MSRDMKKSKLALTLALLLGVSPVAFANTAIVNEANKNTFEMQQTSINTGVALIENVRAALLSSYVNNNGWAPNTAALVATGYIGNIQAGWGQSVTGATLGGGNSYALNLAAPNEYVAQGIAARLGGVASGNVVAVTVPVPANASITESSLARFAVPGDPSRNRMETDIDMNNFGLQNVQVINAQAGNFNTGTFASSLHSQGTAQVDGNATFGSSVSVAETVTAKRVAADEVSGTVVNGESASFNGLTVEGGAAVNGLLQVNSLQSASTINGVEVNATKSITTPLMMATTVDATEVLADSAVIRGGLTAETGSFNELGVSTLTASSANVNGPLTVSGVSDFVGDAVFRNNVLIHGGLEVISVATVGEIKEGGQFLKDRYLGIDATAKNADKLGGIAASVYARKDQANTWSQAQTFSNRVNANGEIYANGKRVVDTAGKLYYQGADIDSRYLGINATAKNADKLGNVAASVYARKDQANTWSQAQTFNNRVNANGEIYANGKRVVDSAGKLYYQGADIDSRYLGINAKAKDAYKSDYAMKAGSADYATNAGKLANIDASRFARRDAVNTFTSTQTMSGRLNANREVYANGKRVIGTDGTLYYRGDNLDNRYLGKTAKAVSAGTADYATNAGKLGGVSAGYFARKDVVNVWDANQTFNRGINVLSTASLSSLAVSGNSTFNGSATFNGSVAMNRGVSVNGGNVQVNSSNDVRVGSISMKQMYQDIQDLKNASGGGGGGGWTTIYDGPGTNYVNITADFTKWRVTYTYSQGSGTSSGEASYGSFLGGTAYNNCGMVSAQVTVGHRLVRGANTFPTKGSHTEEKRTGSNVYYCTATISNFKVKKLEIFR